MERKSVLILEDDEVFRSKVADRLADANYDVYETGSVQETLELVSSSSSPSFILVDRCLNGQMVEETGLEVIAERAGNSFIVVYTTLVDLSDHERYEIVSRGAIRVLDRTKATAFADSVKELTSEFDELLEISDQLSQLVLKRERLVATLLGTNAQLTVTDYHSVCWFSSVAPSGGLPVVGPRGNGPCWASFRGLPLSQGPCWGCNAPLIRNKGDRVDVLVLRADHVFGPLKWVNVRATPIMGQREAPIAVAESVVEVGHAQLRDVGPHARLDAIARGVVNHGFGRIRIYQLLESGLAALRAARSRQDAPYVQPGEHFLELKGMELDYKKYPYAEKAVSLGTGLLVREWDPSIGESPLVPILRLAPPFFVVPVWGSEGRLCSIMCVDFVGVPEDFRAEMIDVLAVPSALEWLQKDFGAQIRFALEDEGGVGPALSRVRQVEQARLEINSVASLADAAQAFRDALGRILPDTFVAVGVRPIERPSWLRLEPSLSFGTLPEGTLPEVSLDDPDSLAAYAFSTRKQMWITDFKRYRRDAQRHRAPKGHFGKAARSIAILPLRFETPVGILVIQSRKRIDWHAEGYVEPLSRLAALAALLVHDIQTSESIERVAADNAAIIAYASSTAMDATWRHWAAQRVLEASTAISSLGNLLSQVVTQRQDITLAIAAAKEAVDEIANEAPAEDHELTCDLGSVMAELAEQYPADAALLHLASLRETLEIAAPSFQVRHILGILIDNAIRAIKTSKQGTSVAVSVNRVGDQAHLLVRDDGPGIPDEVRKQVLRSRIRSPYGGRGVGLLYARGAALQWGGDLRLLATEGETAFELVLPVPTSQGGR